MRFDWVEQIGEGITRQSLAQIATRIDTEKMEVPLVVFNPEAGPRTDLVQASIELPGSLENFVIVDAAGREVPHQVLGSHAVEYASIDLQSDEMLGTIGIVQDGRVMGAAIQEGYVCVEGDTAWVDITLMEHGTPDLAMVDRSLAEIRDLAMSGSIRTFHVRVHLATTVDFVCVAHDVPGHGYKTFTLRQSSHIAHRVSHIANRISLENEFFRIEADPSDGTLIVTDKTSGAIFRGLNRCVDGGDRGDEYNFCPPENDRTIDRPTALPTIALVEDGPARQTLRVEMTYRLPAALSDDRTSRNGEECDVPIVTSVSLSPGVPRIDIRTEIDNRARDHRLRVYFPTPIRADRAWAEGSFDVVERKLVLPDDTADWIEQPVPTAPQRTFVDVSDGRIGLLVANRGLPEYEAIPTAEGTTIAVTLLRCVGWLSRDDFPARRGHAGPAAMAVPDAQCLGRWTFEYALVPHAGDWASSLAFQQAHFFNSPLRAMTVSVQRGDLPPEAGFIEVEPAVLVVSAVKLAEDDDGLIVRVYNATDAPVEGRVRLLRPFRRAVRTNLNERELTEIAHDDRQVTLAVRGKEVVTLKIEF